MRTTVDLPDDLLRRAKSEAALSGRKLRDIMEEGLRAVIDKTSPSNQPEPKVAKPKRVTAHDLLKDLIFEGAEGPADLSTNPKYFDDFGR
jgi:hypothetical protein